MVDSPQNLKMLERAALGPPVFIWAQYAYSAAIACL